MTTTRLSSRAGAKATRETVFAACDSLAASQAKFTVQDVHLITEGSLSNVTIYVKLWHSYSEMITLARNLPSNFTVSIVEHLDELVRQQTVTVESKLAEFDSVTVALLDDLVAESVDAAEKIRQQEAQRADVQAALDKATSLAEGLKVSMLDRDQLIAELRNQLEAKVREINHLNSTHRIDTERLEADHHTKLTAALENQRKVMTSEHLTNLETQASQYRQELSEIRAKSERALGAQADKTLAVEEALQGTRAANAQLESNCGSLLEKISLLAGRLLEKDAEIENLTNNHNLAIQELKQQNAAQGKSLTDCMSEIAKQNERVDQLLSELLKSKSQELPAEPPISPEESKA